LFFKSKNGQLLRSRQLSAKHFISIPFFEAFCCCQGKANCKPLSMHAK